MAIKLGAKVRDTISDFAGVVMCRVKWITGCDRIGVQGPIDKDGKIPALEHFDEPLLEVVSHPKKAQKVKDPGGPKQNPKKKSGPKRSRHVN